MATETPPQNEKKTTHVEVEMQDETGRLHLCTHLGDGTVDETGEGIAIAYNIDGSLLLTLKGVPGNPKLPHRQYSITPKAAFNAAIRARQQEVGE